MSRTDCMDARRPASRESAAGHRPEQNILLVLVTGDRGLAGAFNSNVLKAATKFLEYFKDKNVDILAIGRKGRDFMRRRYPGGKWASSAPDVFRSLANT